jgi:hypothetical protein
MSEWWTYTLSDFLMFSPQVYYRLFELYNRALWPAPLLTVGAGVAILCLLIVPEGSRRRLAHVILGMLWIWIAWAFFWQRYAEINWAVLYVAPFIAAQGALLIGLGAAGLLPISISRRKAIDIAGLALFAAALGLYPLIAPMMGRQWLAGEVFGIAPDPTAIATLALLALAEGRARWAAMIIPALWCAISTVTLWTMGAAYFFLPLAGALVAIGIALARRR